ncbi:MAG: kynureninase [Alphaproteobacteria bacterium]|nr:kynureninase [Alphaproteobacteria bacterium]
MINRADCERLDRRDPLRRKRAAFRLPKGVIYLDGNSLGALPRAVPGRMRALIEQEWGEGLIRSWNEAGWIAKPAAVAARLAPLIGAAPDEVICADSTSVNLFKLLVAALRLRPARHTIVTELGNFPTDLYIAEGVRELMPGTHLNRVEASGLIRALDGDSAVLTLTHVNFRSGRVHDMAALTAAAHGAGALTLWDLSHSVGALPVDLAAAGADLAIGCGYKYLNGGPGGPAFLYVARRHQGAIRPVLTGWMGHAQPFDFAPDYRPAGGLTRLLCGTPPIFGLIALEAALDVWDGVDIALVRQKSVALGDLFVRLVEERLAGQDFVLASPRAGAERGSQVSFRHPEGYAIMQALIARGVIGDFRTPDILRFGFAPLYVRYQDVWDAVAVLGEVMADRAWDAAVHRRRAAVT